MKRRFERTAADEHPERVQSGFSLLADVTVFEFARSASRICTGSSPGGEVACAPDNRSVRMRWADSRK